MSGQKVLKLFFAWTFCLTKTKIIETNINFGQKTSDLFHVLSECQESSESLFSLILATFYLDRFTFPT